MFLDKREFYDLLQRSESRITWSSADAPGCIVVHEWSIGGRCVMREYVREDTTVYWADVERLGKLK